MRWVTRAGARVDRTACPWLIRRFVDPEAEFIFVPAGVDPRAVEGEPFDVRGVRLGHRGDRCSFETILVEYDLEGDGALVQMGRIVRDADAVIGRRRRPEAAGLVAIIEGLQVTLPDDHEKLRATSPLYDALFAYCRTRSEAGRNTSR